MNSGTWRRTLVVVLVVGGSLCSSAAIRADQTMPRFPNFPSPAFEPPREPRNGVWSPAQLEGWLTAVEQHDPGQVDGALAAAAAWTGAVLQTLWVDVQVVLQAAVMPKRSKFSIVTMASAPRPASSARPPDLKLSKDEHSALEKLAARVRARGVNVVVRQAAVLHTDVVTIGSAIAAPPEAVNMGSTVIMHIGDGTTIGVEGANLHWELARMVLSHVTPDPARDIFVRHWYRATVARGQSVDFLDVPHLAQGLKLFPDDPELLLLAGAEREALATPLFQAFAQSFRNPAVRSGISSEDRELSAAERFYRRALEANADPDETRVRLGRVLALQGKYADAVRELRQAREDSPPLLGYYRALFLGTALEGMGDLEAARQSLRLAATIAPASRAPHMALARIARELGDREETRATLDRALARMANDSPADPMWTYRVAPGRRRALWLDEVRAAAKADRP